MRLNDVERLRYDARDYAAHRRAEKQRHSVRNLLHVIGWPFLIRIGLHIKRHLDEAPFHRRVQR